MTDYDPIVSRILKAAFLGLLALLIAGITTANAASFCNPGNPTMKSAALKVVEAALKVCGLPPKGKNISVWMAQDCWKTQYPGFPKIAQFAGPEWNIQLSLATHMYFVIDATSNKGEASVYLTPEWGKHETIKKWREEDILVWVDDESPEGKHFAESNLPLALSCYAQELENFANSN